MGREVGLTGGLLLANQLNPVPTSETRFRCLIDIHHFCPLTACGCRVWRLAALRRRATPWPARPWPRRP